MTEQSSSTSTRSGAAHPALPFVSKDEGNFELLYLRPDPNCPAFQACVQYAPQTHGVLLWDLFPQYETRAPLRENGWNHVKMVISGRRMNVFVNDAPSPTLEVGRLEGDAMTGGLVLQGPGTFANMAITPDAVDGLSPEPAADPLEADHGVVRNWQVFSLCRAADRQGPRVWRHARCFAGLEVDRHGAERPGQSQSRIWPAAARTEPGCRVAEDDNHVRQ